MLCPTESNHTDNLTGTPTTKNGRGPAHIVPGVRLSANLEEQLQALQVASFRCGVQRSFPAGIGPCHSPRVARDKLSQRADVAGLGGLVDTRVVRKRLRPRLGQQRKWAQRVWKQAKGARV